MNKNLLTEDDKFLRKYYSRYGGFWVYPDMLDYSYWVNQGLRAYEIISAVRHTGLRFL